MPFKYDQETSWTDASTENDRELRKNIHYSNQITTKTIWLLDKPLRPKSENQKYEKLSKIKNKKGFDDEKFVFVAFCWLWSCWWWFEQYKFLIRQIKN